MSTDAHAAIPMRGFAIVIGSAALFGLLGPLSRFAYAMGMEPTAFVTWRALIGFASLAAFVAWRVRRGATRVVRWGDLSGRARTAMLVAALAGTILNLCMFIAFDRITIALACWASTRTRRWSRRSTSHRVASGSMVGARSRSVSLRPG